MFNGSRHPRLLIGASSVERLHDRSQRTEARIWESFQMLFRQCANQLAGV